MKMKKIFLPVALMVVCTMSCKKFIDVNKDPNSPIEVSEALLLSPIEMNIANSLSANLAFAYANHYVQNVALNQPIPNHGTYLLQNTETDDVWTNSYVRCMNNLKQLITMAEAHGNSKYAGIGRILMALALGTTTDLFGDVPYSQSLLGSDNFKPVYDKQEDVYKGIQSLLDAGLANINTNAGRTPGNDDYYYKGDMTKWKKLAYTLKARYYMHLTKAPGYTAAAQADLALAALANGMTSNADDLKFMFTGSAGEENPLYNNFDPVSTLVLSEKLVNTLKNRNDPRLPKLVAPAKGTGLYTGRPIGSATLGSLNDYSLPGVMYAGPGADFFVVNYSEALFLKAEATLIKSGFAAAQPIYQEGIKSHMTKLGIAASDVTTYLAARGTLTAANALQMIIEEKVTANYLSIENFVDWRRTGFPTLTAVPNALSAIPRRLIYPESEIIANPQAVQSAKLTDKVWWDN
jgi:hypothetical protein